MEENKVMLDENENKDVSFNPNDYTVIMNMIEEVENSYKTVRASIYSQLQAMNLSSTILEAVMPYTEDDIRIMDIIDIKTIIDENKLDDTSTENLSIEMIREMFLKVHSFQISLLSLKKDVEHAKATTNETLKDYFNYLSSDNVKKSREDRLVALKTALEGETDVVNKKRIESMIATMEASLNFTFIQERFNQFGESEITSIEDGFFLSKKGNYIMDRFNAKITKFGYKNDIFKSFFNIEDNFLPEEYAPFNNLFLFWYMRFVGYADPYSKKDLMLVQALTSAIANLIYHKFESVENEQYFISIIEGVDVKFMNNVERFKAENESYKLHPTRVNLEKEHEKHRREALIKSLHRFNVTDFDEEMDIDDLQKLYSDVAESLINKQMNSIKEESENTDTEEAVVSNEIDEGESHE